MNKLIIAILCLMPMLANAQDNTWERIEQEETENSNANPDQKYLEGAVPRGSRQVKKRNLSDCSEIYDKDDKGGKSDRV